MSVPKLRFSGFSQEWKPAKAGDAFSNRRTKGEEGIPIYSVTLERGMVRRDTLERTMGADAADGVNLRAQPKDLVYNMMRMWQGAVGLAPVECMVSPAYVVLSPKNDTFSAFYEHWFKSGRMLYLLWAYSQGLTSDRLRLYFKDFAQIPLHAPTHAEQSKIANFLTAVDEKISLLTQKFDQLTQYKKGVMQKIFSQELRFKDDEGRDFPEWQPIELEELASKVKTKNKSALVTHVLTNSATQGVVSQSDYFERDIANKNNLDGYYVVNKDDFVYNPRISSTAPVGPIKRNKNAVGVMSPLYTVFRFKQGNLTFLEQYFETNFWHDHMKSVANSGARHDRMNITNDDFFALPILMPVDDEQTKIANFLTAIDEKITNTQSQLAAAEQYKQGLLQQMFV